MQPFAYERATTLPAAIAALTDDAAMPLAGGTELINWMKDGIAAPGLLVDIGGLPGLDRIEADASGLTLGALARMSDVAAHAAVRRDYPAISEALLASASPQIRNMATIGGNLLQRNRCPYFRAEVELPCNLRKAGSGCAARAGEDRFAAIFGWDKDCIAPHASDLAVALSAFDATVHVEGAHGAHHVALADFYGAAGETALRAGEIITAIHVPASAAARRSLYLKIRERRSYEFALVSVAVGLAVDKGRIRDARLALGGVAPKPWRLHDAEKALPGVALADDDALRRAFAADFAGARAGRRNGFKAELALNAAIKAIRTAGGRS
ncbi:MAG: xanthine dehydrogenase family protein subunit M [Parvibaculaceae bacterium]